MQVNSTITNAFPPYPKASYPNLTYDTGMCASLHTWSIFNNEYRLNYADRISKHIPTIGPTLLNAYGMPRIAVPKQLFSRFITASVLF